MHYREGPMTVSVDKPIICPVLIGRTTELTGLRSLLERVKTASDR